MVREPEVAIRDFASLGFRVEKWGHFPDGWDNGGMDFSDRTYLELLWSREPKLTDKTEEGQALKKAEHVDSFGLETSDLDWTGNWLKAAGVKWELGGYRPKPDAPYSWRYAVPEGLAGSPFFVEYGRQTRLARKALPQPNTVDSLTAAWVVVRNLDETSKTYLAAGFAVEPDVKELDSLRLKAQRIRVGSGWLVLAEPTGPGVFQRHLNSLGQGVVGVTLHCADLNAARRLVEDSSNIDAGWWAGIALPEAKTHGLFVVLSEWKDRRPAKSIR